MGRDRDLFENAWSEPNPNHKLLFGLYRDRVGGPGLGPYIELILSRRRQRRAQVDQRCGEGRQHRRQHVQRHRSGCRHCKIGRWVHHRRAGDCGPERGGRNDGAVDGGKGVGGRECEHVDRRFLAGAAVSRPDRARAVLVARRLGVPVPRAAEHVRQPGRRRVQCRSAGNCPRGGRPEWGLIFYLFFKRIRLFYIIVMSTKYKRE